MTTSILIVDDEQGARTVLRHLVRTVLGDAADIAEAGGIPDALAHLEKGPVDFLFLDIQLKLGTGFDLLKQAPHHDFHLVFTTAYDEYALTAFRYSAVDYLLKPISLADLEESIKRVAARSQQTDRPIQLLEELMETQLLEKILLPTNKGEEVFLVSDILRVQASGNYSVFYLESGRTVTVAKTLKVYEALFGSTGFTRVHQSHLVNTSKIRSLMRSMDKKLELSDGTIIPVSRRQYPKLKSLLKR